MKVTAKNSSTQLYYLHKRQYSVLLLICCVVINWTTVFADRTLSLPVAQTQSKQHLVRVDGSKVKDIQIKKIIGEAVKKSPFAVAEIDNSESWDVRFRADEKDSNKIIVEREGETLIKEISLKENLLAVQVAEIIKREYRWQSLRYLENDNNDAPVSVELKVVPIKNPRMEDRKLVYAKLVPWN